MLDWCNILQTERISYDILQEICQMVYIVKQLNYYFLVVIYWFLKNVSVCIYNVNIYFSVHDAFLYDPQILVERINK
jgi:hypothetical protein